MIPANVMFLLELPLSESLAPSTSVILSSFVMSRHEQELPVQWFQIFPKSEQRVRAACSTFNAVHAYQTCTASQTRSQLVISNTCALPGYAGHALAGFWKCLIAVTPYHAASLTAKYAVQIL